MVKYAASLPQMLGVRCPTTVKAAGKEAGRRGMGASKQFNPYPAHGESDLETFSFLVAVMRAPRVWLDSVEQNLDPS
jgi:hypothetical protein